MLVPFAKKERIFFFKKSPFPAILQVGIKCSVNAAWRGQPSSHEPPEQCLPTPSLSPTGQTSSVTALTRSLAASFDVAKESQDFQSQSGDRWHPWVMLSAAEHTAKTWHGERVGHAVRERRGGVVSVLAEGGKKNT